ncbi:MAG TPA: DNA polymerase III subunit chi [Xanthomonadales bacterium]|nr:DNA polymerase III subunit chi [Xanthomonadales bacterium]
MASNSCQVDFYVLEDPRKSVAHLACQLAVMAWEQGLRSLVVSADSNQAQQLDELMWSAPQGRFLPHQLIHEGKQAPVSIGTLADLDHAEAEVVINLDIASVPNPHRFRRLLELVPAREAERDASRIKFRTYREQGLNPQSHSMGHSMGHNTSSN